MPQARLRMTTARVEKLFYVDVVDFVLGGDGEHVDADLVEAPVITSQEEDAPLPLAAAPLEEPPALEEPASTPPGIAATAPRPARRARAIRPPPVAPVAPVVVPPVLPTRH